MNQKKVKIGLIGVGSIGQFHLEQISKIDSLECMAICDIAEERTAAIAEKYNCKFYRHYKDLLNDGLCQAVLIATPHYSHTPIGIASLEAGLHVLMEKPVSVHKADCQRLIAAHRNKKQVFAAMLPFRTLPLYSKLKSLIAKGELGQIMRINWIITDWFRTQAYYKSGTWRATWDGEGGGVLLNQCPHQLDLLQWFCGMPNKIRAFCAIGKYHDIEVEDEVTAYLEYPNGATGVFIASTGEHPGTNRLEIAGQRGRIVAEAGKLNFIRNEIEVAEFSKSTTNFNNATNIWATPDTWIVDIPIIGKGGRHSDILINFANAVLHGERLIASAAEGANSVELANAMLYSSLSSQTVELPLDSRVYARKLKQLINESKKKKICKKDSRIS